MSDARAWFQKLEDHLPRHEAKLDIIVTLLERLLTMSGTQTNSLANLQAIATAQSATIANAVTLLNNLAADLAATSPTGDNPAIDAIVATMAANSAALNAAIIADTTATSTVAGAAAP